ncbi:MAG TPA: hypothetical protein VFH73_13745 [Polyangia bacterium]|jgi:hypothetical protein|nr:hypothetical protein [Polyangia bacterium]
MNGNRIGMVRLGGRRVALLALVGLGTLACSGDKPAAKVGPGTTITGAAGDPGAGGGLGGGDGSGGDGSGATGSGGTAGPVPNNSPWPALPGAAVSVQGGAASSAGGQGQDGGKVHLTAHGAVTIDAALPALPAADVPPAAADVMVLAPSATMADVSAPGNVRIEGGVFGGTDAVRSITAAGNIYVMGTVRSADLGGARQGIKLNAPAGDVFIVGDLDTSGPDGDTGANGGSIEISARAVVVTGKLHSGGGGGAVAGGAAGAVTITVNSTVVATGTIDASGGDAAGAGATSGGAGADVKIQAGGDVSLGGSVRVRGGAATGRGSDARGGAAARLRIDADGIARILGSIDARGGIATAAMAGGVVSGGVAGAVTVGESAPPTEVAVRGPVLLTGGPGQAAGGKGGAAKLDPVDGTITIAGPRAIDASGGDSRAAPGAGGTIDGSPQRDPGMAGVHVTGDILANGGSIEKGGSGNGADAGTVTFDMIPTLGSVTIDDGAHVRLDGGASGGAGTAGGGGHLIAFTKDGDITLAGKVSARGGNAPDASGVGGLGGQAYFFSDNNHNALQSDKGDILITPTGLIDASGGDGSVGGNARNDGKAGLVPSFPDHQEQISVFLNCDGVHGNTINWLVNRGKIIARGGAPNGSGGDVVYHGVSPSGNTAGGMNGNGSVNYSPPSGDIDISGVGPGQPGDYRGE